MMIKSLSAEQRARFPEFVEKWTRIGLCTDPADRPAAEEGVRLAYRIAGFEPPQTIVWCGSPSSMGLAWQIARKSAPSVAGWSWDLGENPVGSCVRTSLSVSTSTLTWDSDHLVTGGVTLVVWSLVNNLVWAPVRALLRDSFDMSFVDGFAACQYDACWFSFYDYYRVVCGLTEQTKKMLGLMQVVENAGWWIPRQDICWISERPNRLIRDDRGRLHCEDGPALSYPDGFSIYAIHGVGVDEQVVMSPRTQEVNKIRQEPNAEVKRIRIERYGWAEYLREVGAVVVDMRDNDVEATKEVLMQTPDGHAVLVCSCPSTARVYCLEVPPNIASCGAAQDWLSGGLSHRVINGA